MGNEVNVAELPVGTPIWIFWDDDRSFYRGQVWSFTGERTRMRVLYSDSEEQEDIDIADFESGEVKYSLTDPQEEQARASLVVPELANLRKGKESENANALVQQLKKLGKALQEIGE